MLHLLPQFKKKSDLISQSLNIVLMKCILCLGTEQGLSLGGCLTCLLFVSQLKATLRPDQGYVGQSSSYHVLGKP